MLKESESGVGVGVGNFGKVGVGIGIGHFTSDSQPWLRPLGISAASHA